MCTRCFNTGRLTAYEGERETDLGPCDCQDTGEIIFSSLKELATTEEPSNG